ncbi:MAG: hypothetical protein K2O91_27385 [Lachnospiraceae bacterium]|nr:hypothetical protein [Lachnospiraceae bacterium]
MTVEEMKAVDIRTVHPKELVDITKLSIDRSLEGDERKTEFIRQINNPYCYRVGNIIVKSSYSGDATLTERFQELVLAV